MFLLNGVTGFSSEPPQLKLKDVKRDCYSTIHIVGGKIEDIIDIQYPRNFYDVVVSIGEEHFHALFNHQYPIMSLASNVDYFDIRFTDEPNYLKI